MTDEAKIYEFQAPAVVNPTRHSLAPQTLPEAIEFSRLIANSDFIPNDYRGKPGNILVAVQWGMELGLGPLQAIQNLAVINGKPSIYGDAMLAVVQASPVYEWHREEATDTEATCTVKRKGREPHAITFTMADAKRAGLADKKGPWAQYPKRMLQMRARSWALRDQFADVLRGLIAAEEAMDFPPAERVEEKPRRGALTKPEAPPAPPPAAISDSDHRRLEAELKRRSLAREDARAWFTLHGGTPAEDGVVHLNRVSASLADQLLARLDGWQDAEDLIRDNRINRKKVLDHLEEKKGRPVHLADLGPEGLKRLVERVGQWRDDPYWRVAERDEDEAENEARVRQAEEVQDALADAAKYES